MNKYSTIILLGVSTTLSLLDWTYLFLFITSLFGAVLFFGFTFRLRISYPLVFVVSHVTLASVTWVLFSITLIRHLIGWSEHQVQNSTIIYLLLGYLVFTFTYVIGIYFFFRYDAKRKHPGLQSIALHLALAGLTFVFVTSSYVVVTVTQNHSVVDRTLGAKSPVWFLVHRDQVIHSHQKQ